LGELEGTSEFRECERVFGGHVIELEKCPDLFGPNHLEYGTQIIIRNLTVEFISEHALTRWRSSSRKRLDSWRCDTGTTSSKESQTRRQRICQIVTEESGSGEVFVMSRQKRDRTKMLMKACCQSQLLMGGGSQL
jgi:hypothetical protein